MSLAVYRQTSFIRGESNNYEDDGWKRPWPEDEIISTERLLRVEEAGHIWEEGVSVAYLNSGNPRQLDVSILYETS